MLEIVDAEQSERTYDEWRNSARRSWFLVASACFPEMAEKLSSFRAWREGRHDEAIELIWAPDNQEFLGRFGADGLALRAAGVRLTRIIRAAEDESDPAKKDCWAWIAEHMRRYNGPKGGEDIYALPRRRWEEVDTPDYDVTVIDAGTENPRVITVMRDESGQMIYRFYDAADSEADKGVIERACKLQADFEALLEGSKDAYRLEWV